MRWIGESGAVTDGVGELDAVVVAGVVLGVVSAVVPAAEASSSLKELQLELLVREMLRTSADPMRFIDPAIF